ncbi:MAG: FAD-binding oxidoreductase [Vicinamibacterales bacterium]
MKGFTMDRRTLLHLMAGLALPVVRASAFQPAAAKRVVVAGGGILGANIAHRLAERGAAVTLLERDRPGHGTTANSFAWINAQKQPHPYFVLSQFGIEACRVLDQETGGTLPIVWGGRLEWLTDPDRAARVAETNHRYQSWGYPVHAIDAARLHALEPRPALDGLVAAYHAESEASVEPVAATELIVARAVAAGATVTHPATVTGLDMAAGRLRAVKTTVGDIDADVLVVACGNDTPAVAAMAGIQVPLTRSPGILVHTEPQPALMSHLLLTPLGQIKQKRNGRIVTGADFGPSASEDTSRASGEAFLQRMKAVLPELGRAPLDKVTLGLRVMPKDGYPIVGFPTGHPDVYVTAMHSGMTLGPLMGRLAALEILDQVEVDLLAPYRLERFGG